MNQTFEAAALEPSRFDFGFAATSFHWLPRMKSFARVLDALKPGGWFAMWWNVYHDAGNPDAFSRATEHLFGGVEQAPEATMGRPAFGLDARSRMGEMRAAGFTSIAHKAFRTPTDFTPDGIAALYGTFSRVRMAPPETRERLFEEAKRIAREDFGGVVTREITASVYVGRKPAMSGA